MNHTKAQSLVEAHFAEALPAAKFRKLKEHLDGCGGCKAYYDRLFGFEAAYDGGKGEADRIGQALFAQLDEEARPARAGIFAFTWPFPTVAAFAIAAAALFVVYKPGPTAEDEFASRGGPRVTATPVLAAVCFVDNGKGPEDKHDLKEGERASCPRGGRLVLAYRQARPGDSLVVFAVRGKEPTPLVAPTALTPGPGTTALPGSFSFAADAEAGEVTLVAVFAKSLDAERVKAALAAGEDPLKAAGEGSFVQRLSYELGPR